MGERGNGAGGVAQNLVAGLELRGGRTPAVGQPGLQQLVVIGPMIPHGDRRDGAQSGCVEDEIPVSGPLHDDIVRVFVLGEDVGDGARRILAAQPREHVAERALILQGSPKGGDLSSSDGAGTTDGDFSHDGASLNASPLGAPGLTRIEFACGSP